MFIGLTYKLKRTKSKNSSFFKSVSILTTEKRAVPSLLRAFYCVHIFRVLLSRQNCSAFHEVCRNEYTYRYIFKLLQF